MLETTIKYFEGLMTQDTRLCYKILLDFDYFSLDDFANSKKSITQTIDFINKMIKEYSAYDVVEYYLLQYFKHEQSTFTPIFDLSRFLWYVSTEFQEFTEDLQYTLSN